MRLTVCVPLLLLACRSGGSGEVPTEPTDTDPPPIDTSEPTEPPTPTTVITTPPPELSAFASRLDDDQRSIVIVSWEQSGTANVHVEFAVAGEETRSSPVRTLEAGPHEEMLLGVPFGTEVTWRVIAETATGTTEGPEQQATTDPLPPDLPTGVLEASDPAGWDPDMDYVLTTVSEEDGLGFGGTWWAMILDRQGRVVWALRSPPGRVIWYPRIHADGDAFLVDLNSYWGSFDGGADSQVVALKIDGTLVQTWDTPGLHHAFTQLPDGTIVWGSYVGGFGAYEENILAMDPAGDVELILACGDWLDSIGERGGCGSNTLSYHEPSNHLLVSWFTFETITEIDLATNEVVRWFGHANGAYGFDPPSSTFWYQHGGYITDAGTLLTSTHVSDFDEELVVREYEIDDASRVLREVWSVGEGQGVTGAQMGEAHRLPGGNTLHNFGTNAHLREYAPDGTVVWEMDWALESEIGRSTPILVDLYAFAPARP